MNLVKRIVADMKKVSANDVLYVVTLHLEKDENRSAFVHIRQLLGVYEDSVEALKDARLHFPGKYEEAYFAPNYQSMGEFERIDPQQKDWWECRLAPLREGEDRWETGVAPEDRRWIRVWKTLTQKLPYQVFELGMAEQVPEMTSLVCVEE